MTTTTNNTGEGWQPIETAPRNGTTIDLWVTYPTYPRMSAGRAADCYWIDGKLWGPNRDFDGCDGELDEADVPTHWMPLPPPPVSA